MPLLRRKGLFESNRVLFLPISAISPNPAQPRKVFAQDGLEELAASIKEHGVLQPLSVRRTSTGLELVSGERRLRASKLAGLTEVPCIIVSVDGQESSLLALVENLQRRDLDFVEEAAALSSLIQTYRLSQEEAARRVGKSQSAVANKLRLLRLPPAALSVLGARLHRAPRPGPAQAGRPRRPGGRRPPCGGGGADGGQDRAVCGGAAPPRPGQARPEEARLYY